MQILNPAAIKFREHLLQVRDGELHQLGITHGVHRVMRRQVLGEVNDVTTAIGARWLEVGVFDDPHVREPGVVDVEPVSIGQATIEAQNHADIGQVTDASELL
ncbi:hypothetical protein G6F32_017094 [Rhizopus arrhizus]|nr:hypothetical protein G6F32_017094 [Rhizopus arrhizus]